MKDPAMLDCLTRLDSLKRPRLLSRAARMGARDYRRNVHLPRLLGYGPLPRHGEAMMRLLEMEDELNTRRTEEGTTYPMLRHIDVLIALVGEARILRASQAELR